MSQKAEADQGAAERGTGTRATPPGPRMVPLDVASASVSQ